MSRPANLVNGAGAELHLVPWHTVLFRFHRTGVADSNWVVGWESLIHVLGGAECHGTPRLRFAAHCGICVSLTGRFNGVPWEQFMPIEAVQASTCVSVAWVSPLRTS